MHLLISIRQEAAGALWNLSFDDRNREAIAAAGGVQALVISFICFPELPQALHYLLSYPSKFDMISLKRFVHNGQV